ncbi:hypothetical protein CPB84DRAFT_1963395 [Gymnopilus junonius]|uniref:3-carboxymuconate cyclase n=1 Tax=Gymnopilus junonius TaxID=109634 RepID=A0A9P5NJZ8_GYMJU|nr:hypothetical protein CPB84DRAFT_1963395 [Gymnopilus junonius]
MFSSSHLSLLALAFASAAAASVLNRAADTTPGVGAAYFIIDDPAQKLVSVKIASDGTLGSARVFSAGGVGLRANHIPPPGKPAALFSPGPDPLFTQGSVQVNEAARVLVTVNPGSNTLSLFSIDSVDPTKLTQVGKAVPSGGEFPNSVAINSMGTTACVLNSGAMNGVNCFTINPTLGLIPKPNTLRSLNVNQTTPPNGPLGSLSTITFSPDDTKLVASVKASDVTLAANGYLAAWSFARDGSLSKNFVKTVPSNIPSLPFTLVPIPGTNAFFSADPGLGFLTADFGNWSTLKATTNASVIDNQILICWASYSPNSGSFYLSDLGTSIITEVHVDKMLNANIVKQYQLNPNGGALDNHVAVIGKNAFLYVMQPLSPAIGVLSVNGPGQASTVQTWNLTMALNAAGLTTFNNLNLQGMATFIKA